MPFFRSLSTLALLFTLSVSAAQADETADAAVPDWDLRVGFSYLATGGNTDTSSTGLTLAGSKDWNVWGLTAGAKALQASDEGTTTAESYAARLQGARDLREDLALTAGLSAFQDRFAGLDLRTVASFGLRWSALSGEPWSLVLHGGPSWTRETRVAGPTADFLGAIAGFETARPLSENASFSAFGTLFANLDETDDYRLEAGTAVEAAVNSTLSLQIGYAYAYDHLPVPGFGSVDSSITAAVVARWGCDPDA